MAEQSHEKGRSYVKKVREFLEKTKNFNIPFDVYSATSEQTTMITLKGEKKVFDLRGFCKHDKSDLEVFIEAKDYETSSDLNEHYKKFIKDCYSVWLYERKIKPKWKARFLFISSHPFYCSKSFKELNSINFLKSIIDNEDEFEKQLNDFLDRNSQVVSDDLLNFLDILFITHNCELISVNLKEIMKPYSIFGD